MNQGLWQGELRYLGLPNRPLLIAHRGWAGRFPENTLVGIALAARLRVDAIEIDVQETSDGELVVSHEDRLERFTDGHGTLHDWTEYELRQLDAAFWFTRDQGRTYPWRGRRIRIPTLETIVRQVDGPVFYLDLKTDSAAALDRLLELVQRYRLARRVVLCSFSPSAIDYVRGKRPDLVIAADAREVQRMFAIAKLGLERRIKPRTTSAWHVPEKRHGLRILSPELMRAARHLGVGVVVWTVNRMTDMNRLLDLGVNGLMTDYPERLRWVMQQRGLR